MSDFKFSCPTCGQHISCDTSNAGMTVACPVCNTALTVPQPPSAAPSAPAAAPVHPTLSIAASQARHTASEASHSAEVMSRTHAQPTAPRLGGSGGGKMSGLAIASLVCSLTGCLGFIPGIICGHLARRNIRRDPSLRGGGLAMAGLIISYLTLAFAVFSLVFGLSSIMAVFKSPEFKKAVADAKQKQEEIQAGHASTTTNAPPHESLWNLNLTTAQFPDQPAAGKIHGQDFTVEMATAQNGIISLRQGANPFDRQVLIFTFLKNGQSVAGKNYDLSPGNNDLPEGRVMPHVHMMWKEEGSTTNKTRTYGKGFALKLQLGVADANGSIPGKIYLCFPDNEKSYVAGSFNLEEKKGAAEKKKKKKPDAN